MPQSPAPLDPDQFAQRVLNWFDQHGRKNLPWQQDRNPYRVWVSEIMLQQTQVTTVIPYYQRFMASFPDIVALAEAELDAVLHHWSGLGYYARARNLHKAAGIIRDQHQGQFPLDFEQATALPGIGPWTASYIALRGLGHPDAFLDGDLILRRAASDGDEPLSIRALREHAERWRPWRGYAVFHLWRDTSPPATKRAPSRPTSTGKRSAT